MASIIFLFSSTKQKDQTIASHMHNCWELVFYESCSGETRIGSKRYSFFPNSFALIPPHTPHDEIHTRDGNLSCIGFEADLEHRIEEVFCEHGEPLIRRTFQRILSEARSRLTDSEEMLSLLTSELILLLRRRTEQKRNLHGNFPLARRFLDENYSTKILFSELAASCGYGYDYFRHRFRELYGMSPQQYVMNKRLQQSEQYLLHSDCNCTEIAYLCGFSDSAQFSTLFRKAYGVSPKQFAKSKKIPPKK